MTNLMHTLEEKAYSHVDKILLTIIDKYQSAPWPEFRDALAQIYIAGAEEALANQGQYPENGSPEDYCIVTKEKARELCRLTIDHSDSIDYGLIDGLVDWVCDSFEEEYHKEIDG